MIIAIYELNGKKLKTTNLTKKLKKLKQEPTILFQQEFEGSIKEAESILDEQLREEEVIEIFKEGQIRDQIKNKYCKDNNITLIRIPYWDFDNIENILKEHLKF